MSLLFGHGVYVALNAQMEVLFIGCTQRPVESHVDKFLKARASWYDEVATINIVSYPGEKVAQSEARALRKASPPKYDGLRPAAIQFKPSRRPPKIAPSNRV